MCVCACVCICVCVSLVPPAVRDKICNHECGNVTAAVGAAWNAGKAKALAAATAHVSAGPYFANGDFFDGVESNLNGHWAVDKQLKGGDPRKIVADVQAHLRPPAGKGNHSYFYMSCTGDQHWTVDPNDPKSLHSACDEKVLARFLLAAEEGCFLGTNGWSLDYEKALGDPVGPAVYTAAQEAVAAPVTAPGAVSESGAVSGAVAAPAKPATLHRNFTSGTFVIFTYNAKGTDGSGEVWWGGQPPAPPTPTPPTPPYTPPTPSPGPPIQCGSYRSTQLRDFTFGKNDVAVKTAVSDAEACCEDCGADARCVQWAWHSSNKACHLHGAGAEEKPQKGTTCGIMQRLH